MKKIIFNSVGSNYTFSFALRTLFTCGNKSDFENLRSYLANNYGGQAFLFYKGREALESALRISAFPTGSKVVASGYTCAVVVEAVVNAGHTPVYADITSKDLNFSVDELKRLYTPEIRAVIVQNNLGFLSDIREIELFCKEKNIVLIEDLAHSVGGTYPDGRVAGTVGDYVVFSFSQDKILDAVSGGALVVRDQSKKNIQISFQTVSLFEQLRDRWYPVLSIIVRETYFLGFGKLLHSVLSRLKLLSRPIYSLEKAPMRALPDWIAQLTLYRFKSLPQEIIRRQLLGMRYLELLPNFFHPMVIPHAISGATCLRIPALVADRDNLISFLKEKDIYISDIWYDVPISPKRYWSKFEVNHNAVCAKQIAKEMINMPTHMTISEGDVKRIVENINLWKKLTSKK